MSNGWIKLHRKSKNHWLYQETPFDRYHAWTDLLLSVNHEQNAFLHGNTLLTVERGQVVTSLRKLGERWGWNQEKVRKFLNLLVSDAMIKIRCDTTKTVITIANWDFYQSDTENRRHDLDTTLTQTVTNKNEKNVKKRTISPIDEQSGGGDGESKPSGVTVDVAKVFAKIYACYPRKDGKAKGYQHFAAYLSRGRDLGPLGRVRLNHQQIAIAVKHYADEVAGRDRDKIKHFDTFMGPPVLDYVEKTREDYEAFMLSQYGTDWRKVKFDYRAVKT